MARGKIRSRPLSIVETRKSYTYELWSKAMQKFYNSSILRGKCRKKRAGLHPIFNNLKYISENNQTGDKDDSGYNSKPSNYDWLIHQLSDLTRLAEHKCVESYNKGFSDAIEIGARALKIVLEDINIDEYLRDIIKRIESGEQYNVTKDGQKIPLEDCLKNFPTTYVTTIRQRMDPEKSKKVNKDIDRLLSQIEITEDICNGYAYLDTLSRKLNITENELMVLIDNAKKRGRSIEIQQHNGKTYLERY